MDGAQRSNGHKIVSGKQSSGRFIRLKHPGANLECRLLSELAGADQVFFYWKPRFNQRPPVTSHTFDIGCDIEVVNDYTNSPVA
jgi:hypothetical protein